MRARRGVRSWRPISAWVDPRVGAPLVLAPVYAVADLIEVVAGVAFINFEARKGTALYASCVFSAHQNGNWRAQTFIAFRSLSGALPDCFGAYPTHSVAGSTYTFLRVAQLPEERHCVVDVDVGNSAPERETLNRAILAASCAINEDINPESAPFLDAVASRYSFFVRLARSQPPAPDSPVAMAMPPLPPGDPPLRKRVETFEKPVFSTAEDLFHAFATHTKDANTGAVRALAPAETLKDKRGFQPLVFCPPHVLPPKSRHPEPEPEDGLDSLLLS